MPILGAVSLFHIGTRAQPPGEPPSSAHRPKTLNLTGSVGADLHYTSLTVAAVFSKAQNGCMYNPGPAGQLWRFLVASADDPEVWAEQRSDGGELEDDDWSQLAGCS